MRDRSFAYDLFSDLQQWKEAVERPMDSDGRREVIYRNSAISSFNTALSFITARKLFDTLVATHRKDNLRAVFSFLISPWLSNNDEWTYLTAYCFERRSDVKQFEAAIRKWLAENA